MIRWAIGVALICSMGLAAVKSPAVRKRLEENLAIVDDNIDALKLNVDAANKNIATLESELKDLSELEAKHLAMRKKYQGFLDNAPAVGAPAEMKSDKDAVQKAAADLALAKQARVREFLSLLDKNLVDVQSRREPVHQQIAALKARLSDYEKAATELGLKKTELEKNLND